MTSLKKYDFKCVERAHRILRGPPNPDDHLSKAQKGLEGGAESIRQTKHVTFLDLPFDIRFMIYKAFFELQGFSDREWQTHLKRFTASIYNRSHAQKSHIVMPLLKSLASNNIRRVTAHNKMSLLLTSKAIFDEASGLFYRLHTFNVPNPDELHKRPAEVSTSIQQVLDKIERIALFHENSIYDSAYSRNFSRHISVLPDLYAQLKVVSIEFQGFDFQFDERIMLALQSTWIKLQLLRLCALNKKREIPRVNLSSIAPGFHWYRELEDGGTQPEPLSKRIKLEAGKNTFFVCRRRQTSDQSIRKVDFTTKQQTPEEETWFPFGSKRIKMAPNPAEVAHGNA
ncbi:MAG: hypothetical protein OHK93_005314 [Ramalina farinacea]|uniref:DUF7730 domain-containing protein n=1 Tax=Ramalina farinacea TaxID=258253 RepID=A0AA43QXK8_9LECA|nr:hypothetical protein [Ramalina farinacea]